MPALGGVLAVCQYFVHTIWQSVILGFVSAPLLVAFVISLAPMLLQLLPRSGGFGELLGKFIAPFSLAGIAFSLLAALVVNETGNYRTIWLFPAAAGILEALIMFWLWVPEGQSRVRMAGLGNRFIDSVYDQITQRDRKLFGGEVTTEDADGASLFESARNLLGNPYELLEKLHEPDPPENSAGVTPALPGDSDAAVGLSPGDQTSDGAADGNEHV